MPGDAPKAAEVKVKRNKHGSWCVYIGEEFVSDHASYDGAAAAANNHLLRLRPAEAPDA